MCWQCDNPSKTTDDFLSEVVIPVIARNGWAVQAVQGGARSAPFAYTIGLTELGLPELVVTGLAAYRSAPVLNGMAAHWSHADAVPVHGEHIDTTYDTCLEVVDLPNPDAHLFAATALYGRAAVRAQQLVWADGRGRWPWDKAHRAGRGGQPVLGPRAEHRTGTCGRLTPAQDAGMTPQAGPVVTVHGRRPLPLVVRRVVLVDRARRECP